MTQRPKKRSLTLKGHRTSVSLEDPFWLEFRRLAGEQCRPINDLAAEIDSNRGPDIGLASAIRLYILRSLTHPGTDLHDAPHNKPNAPAPNNDSYRREQRQNN